MRPTDLVELHQQSGAGQADVVEGQQEDAEQPGGAANQSRDDPPQTLLLIVQHTVGGPVWEGDRAHVSITGVNVQLRQKTEVMRSDVSLTHEAAVEHPGSNQQEGQLEEDEVVMIPGTWKTTEVFH